MQALLLSGCFPPAALAAASATRREERREKDDDDDDDESAFFNPYSVIVAARSVVLKKVTDVMLSFERRRKEKTKRVGGGEKDFCCFWVLWGSSSSPGSRLRRRGWVRLKTGFSTLAPGPRTAVLFLSVVFLQHRLQRVQQEHAERLPVPVVDFHLAVSRDVDLDARRLGDAFKRNRKCRKRF